MVPIAYILIGLALFFKKSVQLTQKYELRKPKVNYFASIVLVCGLIVFMLPSPVNMPIYVLLLAIPFASLFFLKQTKI